MVQTRNQKSKNHVSDTNADEDETLKLSVKSKAISKAKNVKAKNRASIANLREPYHTRSYTKKLLSNKTQNNNHISQVTTTITTTKTTNQINSFAPLIKSTSNASDKQKKFYNTIAIDDSFKANLGGYSKDKFGNLAGNNFDLAMDNAFGGRLIAVLHLYIGENFDFKAPQKALEEKGFKIHRWDGYAPSLNEFNRVLLDSCQLWVISDSLFRLQDEFFDMIQKYFESGKGVYIWGDNDPFYADANKITQRNNGYICRYKTLFVLHFRSLTVFNLFYYSK